MMQNVRGLTYHQCYGILIFGYWIRSVGILILMFYMIYATILSFVKINYKELFNTLGGRQAEISDINTENMNEGRVMMKNLHSRDKLTIDLSGM